MDLFLLMIENEMEEVTSMSAKKKVKMCENSTEKEEVRHEHVYKEFSWYDCGVNWRGL